MLCLLRPQCENEIRTFSIQKLLPNTHRNSGAPTHRRRTSGTPRKYVFWGRDTVFCGSAVHLNKSTKCRQFSVVFAPSLDDSEKSTKLRAHTVNLAFKLRPFVG